MSRGLGQGELIGPVRTRRLSVPAGACCWFGVDPSSVRVAIASIDSSGARGVSCAGFRSGEIENRLDDVLNVTVELARGLVSAGLVPGVVVVEKPAAPKNRPLNPALYFAWGAIVAGLRIATGARVETVMPSQWKALACGKGNISKPKPKRPNSRPEDYAVLRWAQEMGYRGTSWDCADAFGIADFAWRTFELAER